MFSRYNSAGRPVGEAAGFDLDADPGVDQIALDGLTPRVRYHNNPQNGSHERFMEVDGTVYPFTTNAILPPRKDPETMTQSEAQAHNRLSVRAALAQRGILLCGGDDHTAVDRQARHITAMLPFYRTP
ncbi:MAG TPA: hypothetical protein VK674_02515 [Candidatus Limnocylindria bacterium]|nr:hypothetical protein [Candidatus Limnocylindria bacterium]